MTNDRILEFSENLESNRRQLIRYITATHSKAASHAEDILQKAAVTMWKKYSSFTSGTSFQSWARQIVRNEANNCTRSLTRSVVCFFAEEELGPIIEDLQIGGYDNEDPRLSHMNEVLKSLTKKEKKLLQAVYVEGESITTFAEKNKLAPRTCFNKISTIRKKIRKEINERILLEMC